MAKINIPATTIRAFSKALILLFVFGSINDKNHFISFMVLKFNVKFTKNIRNKGTNIVPLFVIV